jgi:hypothetical protein
MEMPTPPSDHTPLAASFVNFERGLRPRSLDPALCLGVSSRSFSWSPRTQ